MQEAYLELLACPDCRGALTALRSADELSGYACEPCSRVFPIRDDIPILLPSTARRYELENELVRDLLTRVVDAPPWLQAAGDATVALLDSVQGVASWEWEDEEYWAEEYQRVSGKKKPNPYMHRIWQRDFMSETVRGQVDLDDKVILEVGSGVGMNFRELFSRHCSDRTLYVATDISFDGLRVNRERTARERSLYVLCSADRLPFRPGAVDVLCYFGILHHTERKTGTIPQDLELLSERGLMVIHEPVVKPSLVPQSFKEKVHQSAHEDRVERDALLRDLASTDLEVLSRREMGTVVIRSARKLLRRFMPKNKSAFGWAMAVDRAGVRVLGGLIPLFRPGEMMLVARKRA